MKSSSPYACSSVRARQPDQGRTVEMIVAPMTLRVRGGKERVLGGLDEVGRTCGHPGIVAHGRVDGRHGVDRSAEPFTNCGQCRWTPDDSNCCSRCPGWARCAPSPRRTTSPRRRCRSRSPRWPRTPGSQLIEPEGRRVRLTPAGRRLADHAVTILAAVDAARLDLDPGRRTRGHAPRRRVRDRHPGVAAADPRRARRTPPRGRRRDQRVRADRGVPTARRRRPRPRADLRLQPGPARRRTRRWRRVPLWSTPWGLGVRTDDTRRARRRRRLRRPHVDRQLAQHRRRGRGAHVGRADRVHPAHRPPDRQPRTRRGPHRSPGTASDYCRSTGRPGSASRCCPSPSRRSF